MIARKPRKVDDVRHQLDEVRSEHPKTTSVFDKLPDELFEYFMRIAKENDVSITFTIYPVTSTTTDDDVDEADLGNEVS